MKKNRAILKMTILIIVFSAFMLVGCDGGSVGADKISIGLSWMEDIDADEYSEDLVAYIDSVEAAGGEVVLLPLITNEKEAGEALDTVDAIIMTGGEDIDPAEYGEAPDDLLEEVNTTRDLNDFLLLKTAIDRDVPVLATCRGLQVLNVLQGGSLYQDISQYETNILHRSIDEIDFEYHNITITSGSFIDEIMGATELYTNSWHHQCIKELGDDLTITATADDGVIEAIELDGADFVLGVQFHPEWHFVEGDEEYLAFFKRLIDEGAKKK